MQMPHISDRYLRQSHPSFLRDVRTDLGLRPDEGEAVAAVAPHVWAQWAFSALGGDEAVTFVPEERAAEMFPDDALPYFAAEAEDEGRRLYDYRLGALAARVGDLYLGDKASSRRRYEHLCMTLGRHMIDIGRAVGPDSPHWTAIVPPSPQTALVPDGNGGLQVRFRGADGFSFPVEGPATRVMSLGPGLTGAAFTFALMTHARQVTLVSGGLGAHFVSRWIDAGLQVQERGLALSRRTGSPLGRLPVGVGIDSARLPEVTYRNDGIAAALGRLSAAQTLDVVVMSAVHTAGTEECAAGVEGAAAHLRPGGLLVVKAPDESRGNEAGMDRVAPRADALFGEPAAAGPCGTFDMGSRAASFAVYRR